MNKMIKKVRADNFVGSLHLMKDKIEFIVNRTVYKDNLYTYERVNLDELYKLSDDDFKKIEQIMDFLYEYLLDLQQSTSKTLNNMVKIYRLENNRR